MEVALNLTAMFLGKVIRDTVIGGKLRWQYVAGCMLLYCIFAITLSHKRFGGVYHENFLLQLLRIGSAYVGAGLLFVLFATFGERMAWRGMAFVGVISYSVYPMSPFVIVWVHHGMNVGDGPLGWSLFVAVIVRGLAAVELGDVHLCREAVHQLRAPLPLAAQAACRCLSLALSGPGPAE